MVLSTSFLFLVVYLFLHLHLYLYPTVTNILLYEIISLIL